MSKKNVHCQLELAYDLATWDVAISIDEKYIELIKNGRFRGIKGLYNQLAENVTKLLCKEHCSYISNSPLDVVADIMIKNDFFYIIGENGTETFKLALKKRKIKQKHYTYIKKAIMEYELIKTLEFIECVNVDEDISVDFSLEYSPRNAATINDAEVKMNNTSVKLVRHVTKYLMKALGKWNYSASQIDKMSVEEIYILCVEKLHYLIWLKLAKPYMSDDDFTQYLSRSWCSIEFPNTDTNVSVDVIVNWFRNANRNALMNDDEYQYWDALPEEITLYRGVSHNGTSQGLSWTLDKEVAEWFSNRMTAGEGGGKIYKVTVPKEHCLCYFEGRNEGEIVLDTYAIKESIMEIN